MVPLDRVVCLGADATPEQVEREVAHTGFSRFPVRGADGQVDGYVHVMDILYAQGEDRQEPIPRQVVRRLAPVAAGAEVEDVLAVMQRTGAHLAQVVAGSGATGVPLGVVFLEDILEELIGEIRDSMQRGPGAGRRAP
jgi:CBS domain containing-hemolysin-like protein